MRRLLKQIFYGLLFFNILLGIGFVVATTLFQPAPTCFDGVHNGDETGVDCGGGCLSCEIFQLKPLQILKTTPVLYEDSFDLIAEVVNPNAGWGVDSFDYTFTVHEANGETIGRVLGQSFILPQEKKAIVKINVQKPIAPIAFAQLQISFDPNRWRRTSAESPRFQFINTAVQSLPRSQLKGEVVNTSPVAYKNIRIIGIFYGEFSQIAAVGQTVISELGSLQRKEFFLTLPPGHQRIKRFDLTSEVNVFQQ